MPGSPMEQERSSLQRGRRTVPYHNIPPKLVLTPVFMRFYPCFKGAYGSWAHEPYARLPMSHMLKGP